MARSPSGKAKVCKTFIEGSIPSRASNLSEVAVEQNTLLSPSQQTGRTSLLEVPYRGNKGVYFFAGIVERERCSYARLQPKPAEDGLRTVMS